MTQNLERLKTAFAEGLGIGPDANLEGLEYQGIREWDSVGHLHLVSELEGTFDVMLETEDVIDMSSFAKAKTILAKYGLTF